MTIPTLQLTEILSDSDSEDEKILATVENFADFKDNPNYMGLMSSG
jgi:hypothetical protein